MKLRKSRVLPKHRPADHQQHERGGAEHHDPPCVDGEGRPCSACRQIHEDADRGEANQRFPPVPLGLPIAQGIVALEGRGDARDVEAVAVAFPLYGVSPGIALFPFASANPIDAAPAIMIRLPAMTSACAVKPIPESSPKTSAPQARPQS